MTLLINYVSGFIRRSEPIESETIIGLKGCIKHNQINLGIKNLVRDLNAINNPNVFLDA